MNPENPPEEVSAKYARLTQSKDWAAVEAVIAFLRRRVPYSVPTSEIGSAIGRPRRQVYGLIKLARCALAWTTGEVIPNISGVGYKITSAPRALLLESIKSGHRADGHLGSEIMNFRRVNRDSLVDERDRDLYVAQQARIRLGEARLAISRDMAPVLRRNEENRALAERAEEDARTPWKQLGLDEPAPAPVEPKN